MKGFFQVNVGCLQIWVCLTFALAELGRRQHPSRGPSADLPAEHRLRFGPWGGAVSGVYWWVMVTLLEGVWVCPLLTVVVLLFACSPRSDIK